MHHAPLHFEGVWCIVGERKGGSHPPLVTGGFRRCAGRAAPRVPLGALCGVSQALCSRRLGPFGGGCGLRCLRSLGERAGCPRYPFHLDVIPVTSIQMVFAHVPRISEVWPRVACAFLARRKSHVPRWYIAGWGCACAGSGLLGGESDNVACAGSDRIA